MDQDLFRFLPYLFFLIITPLAIYLNMRRQKAVKEKIRGMSLRLGLQYSDGSGRPDGALKNPSSPVDLTSSLSGPAELLKKLTGAMSPWKVSGSHAGVAVEIYPIRRGSGKNSRTYTVVRALFDKPLGLGLCITTEGVFSRVGKMFGSQDVAIGEEAFDRRFLIKGAEQGVRSLLSTSAVRDAVLRAFDSLDDLLIDDNAAAYEEAGVLLDEQRLRSILDTLTTVVKAL